MARKGRSWSDELRCAMAASGLTGYQLWKLSGVSESVIGRFRRKQRSLTLETAEKLGRVLGLSLTGKEQP